MAYAERSSGKLTGRWVCDAEFKHQDGSTTRWHKAFASKQEAEGAEAYYRATGQKPPHLITGNASDTYADFVERRFKPKHKAWLDEPSNAQRLDFSTQHLGKLPIAAIRRAELEGFVEKIEKHCGRPGRPVADATINRYLDVVSKVLRYAWELDVIQGVPSFPRRDNENGAKRGAISYALEDAICGWLDARGQDRQAWTVRLLCGTGLRTGELAKITAMQIEVDEEREENCGILLREDQTKNGMPRWVPLVRDAAKKLRALKAADAVPTQHNLYMNLQRALEALGESQKVSPHWFRHTANTRMLDNGDSPAIVSEILGHTLPGVSKMTRRYYHPNKPVLFAVAQKVQNRLGESRQVEGVVQFKKPGNTGLLEATPGIEPGYTVLQTGKQ